MEEQDILILGSTGRLGKVLTPLLAEYHNINAPTHHMLDVLSQTDKIHKIFCPTIILNLIGFTDVVAAEDPSNWNKVLDLNLWLPRYLNKGLLHPSTKIVHISTDYVYDGDVDNSKETDVLKPFNKYGISKALCDLELLKLNDKYQIYIIRTSFKPKKWPYPNAFDDIISNADTTEVISKLITSFINYLPLPGIYNLGTEPKSVYELVSRNNPDIQRSSLAESRNLSRLFKKNLTMDLTKFYKIKG